MPRKVTVKRKPFRGLNGERPCRRLARDYVSGQRMVLKSGLQIVGKHQGERNHIAPQNRKDYALTAALLVLDCDELLRHN